MADNDLFAPPTKEELAMFAPPSQDELQAIGAGPQPSQAESLARGTVNGATLGFGPQIAGAANALTNAANPGDQNGLFAKAMALNPVTLPATLARAGVNLGSGASSISDLVKNYISGQSDLRRSNAAAQQANPKTFAAGGIAGSLATAPLLPIGSAPSIAGRIAGAAGLGAVAGLGNSQQAFANPTQENVMQAGKNMAMGAGIGAVAQPFIEQAIAPAVGFGAGKLGQAAGWLGKKALNVFADTPEKLTGGYLANPETYNNALPQEGVAQKLADTLGQVRADTGAANEAAMSTLSSERAPTGMPLSKAIDLLNQFDDPAAKDMANTLMQGYQERAGGVAPQANAGYLTEQEVNQVKKTLQGLADWKSPLPTGDQAAARQAAGSLNQGLKSENMDYQAAMGDLSQNIQAKQGLAQKFGIKPDFTGENESGFTYSDSTLKALKDIVRGNKVDRMRILQSLKDQGYGDLADDVEKSLGKAYFEGQGSTNGGRRVYAGTALGGALGRGVGHMLESAGVPGASEIGTYAGAGLGSIAGAAADKYGPQIAKKTLDVTVLTQQLASTPGAQQFIGAIKQAASQGQGALAATHFILSQTEPAYQQAVSGGQ